MKRLLPLFFLLGILSSGCKPEPPAPPETPAPEPPVTVSKSNDTKLYMHYMPWFHSKDFSGYWGYHWTMNSQNPDFVDTDGKRQIAAHYYPLVGPYDSSDPDLVDYHLLLMKYSGIDGVLIDWYGSHDVNDYEPNRKNANALINRLRQTGLKFAIVYEEFTAENVANANGISAIDAARADIDYLERNYTGTNEYIEVNNEPLLLTFGPRYFNSSSEWDQILSAHRDPIQFMPLWNFSNKVGFPNADGEFAWVDFNTDLSEMEAFYEDPDHGVTIGSAYPGFHDFYQEAGVGSSFGFVPHGNGQTLDNTLQKAAEYDLDIIQLVTWNDFGEGTIFEPTEEFGFQYLEKLQQFSGVSYDIDVLEIIYQYYLKRKEYAGNASVQETLDEAFDALNDLDVEAADSLISTL